MKRRYHHGQLRAALIEAAADVAAREGVQAVRMRPLARALGVSSGAPFRHFGSVDALLVAVAEAGADEQLAAMRAAADPSCSARENQRRMGVAYVRWAVERPGYFRVLSRIESLQGSARLQEQQAAFSAQLQADLGGGGERDGAGERTRVLAARALVYGLARMAVDGLLGQALTPAQAEVVADRVLRSVSMVEPEEAG